LRVWFKQGWVFSTFNSQLLTANMFKRGYKGKQPVSVGSDRILALCVAAIV